MLKLFPKSLLLSLSLLLMTVVAPAVLAAPPVQEDQTIVDIAASDERFSTLVAALQAAGLDRTLSGPGPFTVFAPTNDAFAALPEGAVDALLGDIPALSDVLLYHVVSGELMAADVAALEEINTLLGEPAIVTIGQDNTVMIGDGYANVVITDIEASNGVIHVIDAVLMPPSMQMDDTGDAEPMAEPEAADDAAAEEMVEPETEAADDAAAAEPMAEPEAADDAAAEEMVEPEAEATDDATMTAEDSAGAEPADGGFYLPRNPYYGYYYYPRYNNCYYGCYQPYYYYRSYHPAPYYYRNYYPRHW